MKYILIILAICLFFGIIPAVQSKNAQSNTITSILNNPNIPQDSINNPKHTIIEFFDYNCGYCKMAKPVAMSVMNKYDDISYYYMEFPILTASSLTASKVGVAIYSLDPLKYYEYNEKLMTTNHAIRGEKEISDLVTKLGLDWNEVKNLSESKEIMNVLLEIRKAAEKLEVDGTPTFYVDGKSLPGTPTSEEDITKYF